MAANTKAASGGPSFLKTLRKDMKTNYSLYLLVLPVIIFYIIFMYKPMYGAIIAFKDFTPGLGITGSPWVGLKHFEAFITDHYFVRLLKNTLLISLYSLVWGFPAPILLAVLLNELRHEWYKKTVQTISYLPHFVSMVVICGMIKIFCSSDGIINDFMTLFGGAAQNLLQKPQYFRTIYIITDIWQGVGWGTIIYLSALASVDQSLYEAAMVDGAGRFRRIWHITLPGILPTIVILLIMRIGSLLSVGYEKIILLYNPMTYETADVISSYVYRKGLQEFNWSYSSAVGLFNSVINMILLVVANKISRAVTETSLW